MLPQNHQNFQANLLVLLTILIYVMMVLFHTFITFVVCFANFHHLKKLLCVKVMEKIMTVTLYNLYSFTKRVMSFSRRVTFSKESTLSPKDIVKSTKMESRFAPWRRVIFSGMIFITKCIFYVI